MEPQDPMCGAHRRCRTTVRTRDYPKRLRAYSGSLRAVQICIPQCVGESNSADIWPSIQGKIAGTRLALNAGMDDLLQMLHHYRSARTGIANGLADEAERTTALAFGSLLGEDPPWHGLDPITTRRARNHPVTVAMPTGFFPGEIRSLTGAGVLVQTAAEPSLGTRCVVRIDDQMRRQTYLLPSVVSMVEDAEFGCIACLFDGPCEVTERHLIREWAGGTPIRRRRSQAPPA